MCVRLYTRSYTRPLNDGRRAMKKTALVVASYRRKINGISMTRNKRTRTNEPVRRRLLKVQSRVSELRMSFCCSV